MVQPINILIMSDFREHLDIKNITFYFYANNTLYFNRANSEPLFNKFGGVCEGGHAIIPK